MRFRNLILSSLVLVGIFLCSCQEVIEGSKAAQPRPIQMYDVHFDSNHIYFATDGSMTQPVDSNAAKLIPGKIDLTFVYPISWSMGFLDPVARSQHNTNDDFYQPWLSNSVETRFYTTNLILDEFAVARNDEEKLIEFFETRSTGLIQNVSFPEGTLMHNFSINTVIGFKNLLSGKRGLIRIRFIETVFLPDGYSIYLDIIREH